jgi:hypothetical protein
MLFALLAMTLAQGGALAAPPVSTDAPAQNGSVVMTAAQIRTYNAHLARSDPAYIRCERNVETGSLVKKRTACRTNAEWRRVHDIGNQNARETMEGIMLHNSTRDLAEEAGRSPLGH